MASRYCSRAALLRACLITALAAGLLAACAADKDERPIAVVNGLRTIEPGTSSSRLRGKTYEEHFARCWEPPAAVEHAPLERQTVEITGSFGLDGSAIKVEIVDLERMARDPAFRAMAESLRLAVEPCGLPPRPPDGDYAVLMHVLKMKLDPSLMIAAR